MIRTIIAVILFFAYLLFFAPLLLWTRYLDRKGRIADRDRIVTREVGKWARFVIRLAGGTVMVHGLENVPRNTPVVFIGNHQSYLDIPILLGFIDVKKAFIAKIELLSIPGLAGWMKLMQCTFLDRKDMRQSVRAMQEAVETVKAGYPLVIFPEGTRSRGNTVGEFKAGSFKLALQAGVPIVPFTLDGSWRLFEEKGKIQNSHVRLTIHPPIPTADLSREEAAALPAKVRDVVISAMDS
ncbi:MAG: 1-acyl-sn-glycerol-3-phosphate acyltransferase [Treponema sp.]|nr:1-acyl-sn-glycerol-3-phosphate acyltransferase [Treponema sp.]